MTKANFALKTVEEWASKAREAQERKRQMDPQVQAAEQEARTATARVQAAQLRLGEAAARQKQITEEVASLAPGRRIARFIENRAQSSDYKGQLGLVSLARRDFEELSNLFANTDALQQMLDELKKKEMHAEDEAKQAEMASSEAAKAKALAKRNEAASAKVEAEQLKKASDSIDRIVLLIDDLDRCRPAKVVDVLQAVHLLLAFPLFAVVVGVDQRCLRQSIQEQFKGLLTPVQKNGGKRKLQRTPIDSERPTTALDYLEKIFHIPFHLPAMEKTGFGDLIEKLTEPVHPTEKKEGEIPVPIREEGLSATPGDNGTVQTAQSRAPENMALTTGAPVKGQSEQMKTEPQSASSDGGATESTQTKDLAEEIVGSIPLERWERDALKDYHALVPTPRGATRLLNTYRLVRAGVPKSEWASFCGDQKNSGEFRMALLLLAASAGCPAVSRDWFAILSKDAPITLSGNEHPEYEWSSFARLYNDTVSHLGQPLQQHQQRLGEWLSRVERFTF